jgi:hypothetical protein
MLMVAVGVGRLGQSEHLLAYGGVERMHWGTATIPMNQGGGTLIPVRRPQAMNLPNRNTHQFRCFHYRHTPPFDLVQDQQSSLLFAVQCHCLFHGVTFSLNS